MLKPSLFAALERQEKLDEIGDPLARLSRHVDFAAIAAVVDEAIVRSDRSLGGRPPWPTELMIRLLILQQMFNLSDDQLEYQVLDRMSFQRFLRLKESGRIPDAKTMWAFRARLIQSGLGQNLFDEVGRQLEENGLMARKGQIVDATLIPVPIQRNSKEDNETIKEGKTPKDWKKNKERQKDTDARWTKKNGKNHFGYKASINADVEHKLIRKVHISPANEHDSTHLIEIVDPNNSGKDLLADKGYQHERHEAIIKAVGLNPRIQHKAKPGRKPTTKLKDRNHRIAKIRARVEHVFAGFAQMGGKAIRCIGLSRARFTLMLKASTYNLKRMAFLIESRAPT